jgi:hypothetical protein
MDRQLVLTGPQASDGFLDSCMEQLSGDIPNNPKTADIGVPNQHSMRKIVGQNMQRGMLQTVITPDMRYHRQSKNGGFIEWHLFHGHLLSGMIIPVQIEPAVECHWRGIFFRILAEIY